MQKLFHYPRKLTFIQKDVHIWLHLVHGYRNIYTSIDGLPTRYYLQPAYSMTVLLHSYVVRPEFPYTYYSSQSSESVGNRTQFNIYFVLVPSPYCTEGLDPRQIFWILKTS